MTLDTIKSRAVDRSTIQFWTILAKGHSTLISIKFLLHKQSENPYMYYYLTETFFFSLLYGSYLLILCRIFGFKQQGPAAVEAVNVFHHLFYEGNVDIFSIEDPLQRNATIGKAFLKWSIIPVNTIIFLFTLFFTSYHHFVSNLCEYNNVFSPMLWGIILGKCHKTYNI